MYVSLSLYIYIYIYVYMERERERERERESCCRQVADEIIAKLPREAGRANKCLEYIIVY